MSHPLYESMRTHAETGPVLEMLDLVEPHDDFSRALVLVRDCFSPSNTLRELSRKALRRVLQDRINLMTAFNSSVLEAAREIDPEVGTFEAAMKLLPPKQLTELVVAYGKQIEAYEATKRTHS